MGQRFRRALAGWFWLGSCAVAVTQLQLEPWGPGAPGACPRVSLQRVSGCLHGAFLCGLGWSSSQHGGLRAVELFTLQLGAPGVRVRQGRLKMNHLLWLGLRSRRESVPLISVDGNSHKNSPLPRGRDIDSPPQGEECQSHIVRGARWVGKLVMAIFGKCKLLPLLRHNIPVIPLWGNLQGLLSPSGEGDFNVLKAKPHGT